jgi:signal transduction histidine kinase
MEPGDHNLSFEDWMSFIHPDDLEYVQKIIKNSQVTLSDISFYHRIIRKDGAVRHIHSQSKYEFDEKGKPVGLYGIAHDVTEIKELEGEMMEQQKQEQKKITATAMEAQEKERNAIGQELHDNVNQILVGTKLLLSMVKNDSKKGREIIETSIKNLQDAINENRKISHVMVAPDLETNTLVEQFDNLIGTMLETAGMKVQLSISDLNEDILDGQRKINIYRIAQDQCTNIVKYAKAKTVKVRLETADNIFKMLIADDGVGMEPDKEITGIGLRNINGRLSIFNGSSKITTAPGKGFALEVTIPC